MPPPQGPPSVCAAVHNHSNWTQIYLGAIKVQGQKGRRCILSPAFVFALKHTGIEPATFGSGIRRATIAPMLLRVVSRRRSPHYKPPPTTGPRHRATGQREFIAGPTYSTALSRRIHADKKILPRRDSNPGLLGESQLS